MNTCTKVTLKSDRTTLRDQFAMAALQGLISATSADTVFNAKGDSVLAYEYADEMMEARDE